MNTAGLEVFDRTVQVANVWLKDIAADLGPDRKRAYEALRAVLQTLRDRLTVEEAAQLSAQLPMLIRGIFFDGWRPSEVPHKTRRREQFLEEVASHLRGAGPMNLEATARAVFRTMSHHLDPGEVESARRSLPEDIRALWPIAARPGAPDGGGGG